MPPPRVRLSSHGSSNNLLFGTETDALGEGGGSSSSGGGRFDAIYVKKSTFRRTSSSGNNTTGNATSPSKKKKAAMKRAQTTPEFGRHGGARTREAPDDFFCPITQEVINSERLIMKRIIQYM
jgi:hypothetical protein